MRRNEAIEITTFRLVKGCTTARFVDANRDVDAWLRQQPGFRSRRITVQQDGKVTDVLVWDSVEQAESSMRRLMHELAGSPVHALIDQRTVSWNASPVIHRVAIRAGSRG